MSELTWVNAKWADGPKVAKWLEKNWPELACEERVNESNLRRLREWRSGATAGLHVIDRMLTSVGAHLYEVPDDFWVADRNFNNKRPQPNCEACGDLVPLYSPNGKRKSAAAMSRARFCSAKCMQKVDKTPLPDKNCAHCGKAMSKKYADGAHLLPQELG